MIWREGAQKCEKFAKMRLLTQNFTARGIMTLHNATPSYALLAACFKKTLGAWAPDTPISYRNEWGPEDELTLSLNCLLFAKYIFPRVYSICVWHFWFGSSCVCGYAAPNFASASRNLAMEKSLLGQSWSNYTHTLFSQQFAIIFGVL